MVDSVMGPTGAGKSTVCLHVKVYYTQHSRPFELDNKDVFLVDMPNLDDTAKSDSDIMEIICTYLALE